MLKLTPPRQGVAPSGVLSLVTVEILALLGVSVTLDCASMALDMVARSRYAGLLFH